MGLRAGAALGQLRHGARSGRDRLAERELRRLQLAAEASGASGFLVSPGRAAQGSPAALRLAISGRGSRTVVRILKRRGGDVPAPVTLDLFPRSAARPCLHNPARSPAAAPPRARKSRRFPLHAMLWLALFFPQLPLETGTRSQEASWPVVVACRRRRVPPPCVACNARARAAGMHPGLGVSAACALAPELTSIARDDDGGARRARAHRRHALAVHAAS